MKYLSSGIIIAFVVGWLTYTFLGQKAFQQEQIQQEQTSAPVAKPEVQQQESQIAKPAENVSIEDIKVGTGAEARVGNTVSVQYTGTLVDGTKFDSSYDHGQPFSFTLGQGQVIQGWERGVPGMKVGGKRKLTIPPSLAYGAAGIPGRIPTNSTLVFEIELLDVK